MSFKIEYACVSAVGKCRSINQDNFICIDKYLESENEGSNGMICGKTDIKQRILFGVFDGLGGELCGEMAAYIASKNAKQYDWYRNTPVNNLRLFCEQANSAICHYAEENGISAMGTTAAMLLFDRKAVYLCNIGDSKIFQYSDNRLEQISVDHIGVAVFGQKPPLTQNLGIPSHEMVIDPFTATGYYNSDDQFLICSDGLTDMVSNEDIAKTMEINNPAEEVNQLLNIALDNGGKDNITIISIRVIEKTNALLKWLRK